MSPLTNFILNTAKPTIKSIRLKQDYGRNNPVTSVKRAENACSVWPLVGIESNFLIHIRKKTAETLIYIEKRTANTKVYVQYKKPLKPWYMSKKTTETALYIHKNG